MVVYRQQQRIWFSTLDRRDAERLRQIGQACLAYSLSALTIQNTPASVHGNINHLAKIRKSAPPELWPVFDLRAAKDYAMMARLEQRAGDLGGAAGHKRQAADLLRSIGWQDVSDDALARLADKELESRVKN